MVLDVKLETQEGKRMEWMKLQDCNLDGFFNAFGSGTPFRDKVDGVVCDIVKEASGEGGHAAGIF